MDRNHSKDRVVGAAANSVLINRKQVLLHPYQIQINVRTRCFKGILTLRRKG